MDNKEPLDRIRVLLLSLPASDINIGKKFLANRDFESLQLLVDSAIVRVKRGLTRENIKEEYLKVDLREIDKLKSEVDTYCMALRLPNQEDDYPDNYEDEEEFNEEYY